MRAVGFARLALHYLGVFGPFGAILFADRVARRLLPLSIYRATRRRDGPVADYRADGMLKDVAQGPVAPGQLNPVAFSDRFPDAAQQIITAADDVVAHRFDILGSGPTEWGDPIDWAKDVKSGHSWPASFYKNVAQGVAGADVKVPWELSRFHHGVVLAQAYLLSGDDTYASEFSAQWGSWREANPYPYGVNWTSAMEASIRAVNVLYAAAIMSTRPGSDSSPMKSLTQDMRQHGTFIERNLEVGSGARGLVTGNHYLANLCGLACIGLALPDLPEAARWRRAGLSGLAGEARRQVLPDGVWWEGSTSYHRFALELLLVPALIARRAGADAELGAAYWRALESMCEAVIHLTGPDGAVPMVGDGDDGRLLITAGYPSWPRRDQRYLLATGAALFGRGDMKAAAGRAYPDLFWLLGERGVRDFDAVASDALPTGVHPFPQGGITTIRGDRMGDFALMRTGGSVPGAPTGHLHNDALSVELWLDGDPVTVDPGTLAYTSDPAARDELRSTLTHATVSLDGNEQNRFVPGHPFELAVETEVELLGHRSDDAEYAVQARASRQGGAHTRTLVYGRQTRQWRIEDDVTGAGAAIWSWPLAPGRSELGAKIEADFSIEETTEDGRMAPSYGVSTPIRIARHRGRLGGEGRAVFHFQSARSSGDKTASTGGEVAAT